MGGVGGREAAGLTVLCTPARSGGGGVEGYSPSSDLPRHLPATPFSLSFCCLRESEGSFDQQGGGGCGTPLQPACSRMFRGAIKVPFHRLVIAGTRLLSWHRGHIKGLSSWHPGQSKCQLWALTPGLAPAGPGAAAGTSLGISWPLKV